MDKNKYSPRPKLTGDEPKQIEEGQLEFSLEISGDEQMSECGKALSVLRVIKKRDRATFEARQAHNLRKWGI